MTGIIYGSTMGNTENAAMLISKKIGDSELVSASDLTENVLSKYDTLLLGSSTWGMGDLQADWESKIDLLKRADLAGKRVGFFGTGDQESYDDTFGDALGTLYEAVKETGCSIIGSWPVDGYIFSDSTAVVNGKFVGLMLDDDNQAELTESRINMWVENLAT